jgi:predicted DNA-binding ribbon-helix-helix protein
MASRSVTIDRFLYATLLDEAAARSLKISQVINEELAKVLKPKELQQTHEPEPRNVNRSVSLNPYIYDELQKLPGSMSENINQLLEQRLTEKVRLKKLEEKTMYQRYRS